MFLRRTPRFAGGAAEERVNDYLLFFIKGPALMPEMRFQIEWPDGAQETCYSPSLVVKSYLSVDQVYSLEDFVGRSRTALQIASDRVKEKYGMACGLALGQLQKIETTANQYHNHPQPQVRILKFIE